MKQTQKVYINHLDKMKPLAFIEMMRMIKQGWNGRLTESDNDRFGDGLKITEKIDGSALRFGLDRSGVVFAESATSPPMVCVGSFALRDISKGYDGSVGANFDNILYAIKHDHRLIDILRKYSENGIKIITEMLYIPMLKTLRVGLVTFIRIPYELSKLGHVWTIFPIKVLNGDGLRHVHEKKIIEELVQISTPSFKYMSPRPELTSVIDLTEEIANLDRYLASRDFDINEVLMSRKKIDRDIKMYVTTDIMLHQEAVANKILSYVTTGLLGSSFEGLVIEFPNHQILKVITPEFKNTTYTP